MEHIQPTSYNTADDVAGVRKLFRALWHRRRRFVIVFAAIMFPLFIVIELWPSSYYASGFVIIGNLEPAGISLSAAIEKLGDPADLASQLLIAKSPRMIRLALERPGVVQAIIEECSYGAFLFSSNCEKLKPGSGALLNYVSSHYVVQAEGRSRIISIGYSSGLPEVSFVLANALLITYLEDQRGENAQARETAISWLLKKQKANEASQPEQSFYGDLYKHVTDFETERRNLPNPARLVSLAEFPLQPTSPKRFRMLAAAFVIATGLAGFLVTLEDLKGWRWIRLPGAMREPETGTGICTARHAPARSTPSPSGPSPPI